MSSKLLHSYIARLPKKKQYNNLTIYQSKPGLTLIELLVVVAILGILASVTSVLMIGHQKQARDAQRKNDMQVFKKAMESAKTDCRGSAYYPRFQPLGTALHEEYNFMRQADKNNYANAYLLLSNLMYLKSPLQDPKYNLDTIYYRFAHGPNTGIHCPGNTSPPTLTIASMEYWVARAKLENSNDPESVKSYNNCSNTITLEIANGGIYGFESPVPSSGGDGFYYVCSE